MKTKQKSDRAPRTFVTLSDELLRQVTGGDDVACKLKKLSDTAGSITQNIK